MSLSRALNRLTMVALKDQSMFFHDEVESPHEYHNDMNVSHVVNCPGASKWKLTFDSRCNTENGCDYLELWTDSTKTTRLHRWEGDSANWPKEVEIENPDLLYFTFHSDGSVTRWGYKIDIDVEVIKIETNWLLNLRDMTNYLMALMNKVLIDGSFFAQEKPCKALDNVFVKYGIKD